MKNLAVVGALGGLIVTLVFMPVITYWAGYFGGWILTQFVGDNIVRFINIVFNRDVVNIDILPMFFGGLAVISSYFKSTITTTNSHTNS